MLVRIKDTCLPLHQQRKYGIVFQDASSVLALFAGG